MTAKILSFQHHVEKKKISKHLLEARAALGKTFNTYTKYRYFLTNEQQSQLIEQMWELMFHIRDIENAQKQMEKENASSNTTD